MEETNTQDNMQVKKSNKMIMVVGLLLIVVIIVVGVFVLLKGNGETEEKVEGLVNRQEETEKPSGSIVVDEKKKGYTLSDIAEHGTDADCWMAIDGKVYNVTEFVSKHPGGKLIVGGCGKDASLLFNERPTNSKGPHPEQAKEMLVNLYIGELQN